MPDASATALQPWITSCTIYNRLKLLFGGSVNDEFNYFFNTTTDAETYPSHHREFTRAEIKSTLERAGFRVVECRVIDVDIELLLNFRRRADRVKSISDPRDFVLRFLGEGSDLLARSQPRNRSRENVADEVILPEFPEIL